MAEKGRERNPMDDMMWAGRRDAEKDQKDTPARDASTRMNWETPRA